MTKNCKISHHILKYIEAVEKGKIRACKEQDLLVAFVRKVFETEDVYCDNELLEDYLSLEKYFPFRLFDWEIFCFALHNCVFRADGMPRFPDLFICVGRGAGKNGYLAYEDFALISPYSGLREYDIDICATVEKQAKRSFDDIYNVLETHPKKLGRFFRWNKEEITCIKTGSVIRYHTKNPRSKDGMRSGKVDFDEVHEYENYANLEVFTTGLGKKRHPRRTFITTNGNVRDGVLDDMLADAKEVLNGTTPDGGMLYFICKLDDAAEIDNEANWEKPNPSLFAFTEPNLLEQIRKEYIAFKKSGKKTGAFMTKRMNLPLGSSDQPVTLWENLVAASVELPDLDGRTGVVGIDYAQRLDFVVAGVLIRDGDMRYWIDHTWVCRTSPELARIHAPLDEWAAQELLTYVDDVEVSPELIADWVYEQAGRFNLKKLALDNFRYALLARALANIGFDAKTHKNVYCTRPSDLMKLYPVVCSMFDNHQIAWGEKTMMRWYTNNTKAVPVVKRGSDEQNLGNMTFGKIEPKSRKTDGFFALLAAMSIENELDELTMSALNELPVLCC